METSSPRNARTVVVGGGTMGADVAVVLARGGAHVTVVDPHTDRRNRLLVLTDAGHLALARALPIWLATHADVEAGLPDQDADRLRAGLLALA